MCEKVAFEVFSTSKNYLYALKILVVFGVENGMKYVEQGVFFNLKTRIKRAEEVSNGVISFDVFLAMNRRAIG